MHLSLYPKYQVILLILAIHLSVYLPIYSSIYLPIPTKPNHSTNLVYLPTEPICLYCLLCCRFIKNIIILLVFITIYLTADKSNWEIFKESYVTEKTKSYET